MANCIACSIPNTLTCLNLFSGYIACTMAFKAGYNLTLLFIILSTVSDSFDGMMVRLLDTRSPTGKDLDSLVDDVSSDVAPSLVIFSLSKEVHCPAPIGLTAAYMPHVSPLISVFSVLRLAKFDNDTHRTSSSIRVPIPANAFFWASLAAGIHPMLISDSLSPLYLLMLICLSSWLLVPEIPMFSLKFKDLSWEDNKISFIFLIVCIPLLVLLEVSGFATVIVWYIVLSFLTRKSR